MAKNGGGGDGDGVRWAHYDLQFFLNFFWSRNSHIEYANFTELQV